MDALLARSQDVHGGDFGRMSVACAWLLFLILLVLVWLFSLYFPVQAFFQLMFFLAHHLLHPANSIQRALHKPRNDRGIGVGDSEFSGSGRLYAHWATSGLHSIHY
jgi:hypothetical protein